MILLTEELERGFRQPCRGDQINTWGAEAKRCAEELDAWQYRLPPTVMDVLHELFFEVGRLCRDAERGQAAQ